jgi:ribosomal protein S18 acetylase RimI-like enzyme
MSATTVEGGCLCGAVRFEVTLPSKWCAHCHCSMCRRSNGAAFVTWFGVPREGFRWLAGAGDLARHRSSPAATRSFCRACGSGLLFESERWPEEVHVTLASLDGPLDREPQAHCFFDDRAPWTLTLDRLPRFGGPTGTERLSDGPVAEAVTGADARVRLAGKDDAGNVARLLSELAALEREDCPPELAAAVARFLGSHSKSFVLLAESEGRAAGVAVVLAMPALAEGRLQLVLDDVYVEPSARRRGLGAALVGATLAAARALSAPRIFLSTRRSNDPARRLFERHGLRATEDVLYVWAPPGHPRGP